MTWLLTNGENSNEFSTKEEAEEQKAKLAGLASDLSIEEKNASNDAVEADYVEMPYGKMETETEPHANDSNGDCPACGKNTDCLYRCSECGHDLAGVRGIGTGSTGVR